MTPHEKVARDVGQRLRSLRRESKLKQRELAERAGVAVSSLQEIERGWGKGRPTNPTLMGLLKLAEALECDPVDLLTPLTPARMGREQSPLDAAQLAPLPSGDRADEHVLKAIETTLADGAWHPRHEVHRAAEGAVGPGWAYRRAKELRLRGRPVALAQQGQRLLADEHIDALLEAALLEPSGNDLRRA